MSSGNTDMKRTVFLLSSWYSGATMLTMLLDRHPAVVSNGEAFPYNPRDRRHVCSCGKHLHECEFYRYAAAHMLDDPKLFLREPLLDLPSPLRRLAMSPRFAGRVRDHVMALSSEYRSQLDAFQRAHILFMRRALEYSGADIYVDGTKSLRRAEILLPHLDGKVHLWLLVKDCRGYCASMLRKRYPKNKVAIPVQEWLDYIRFSERLARAAPAAVFRIVRYEDLCRHPSRVLDVLFSDLGLGYDERMDTTDYSAHLLGNRIRTTFDGRIESVEVRERWRHELDSKTQEEIVCLAGTKMAELGYV